MIKFIILYILKLFDNHQKNKIFKFLKNKGYCSFNIFFDIGAHRGETIDSFTKIFKIKKIYSFEASEINFEFLKKNVQDLNKKNVEIFLNKKALGKEKSKILIKHLKESSSSTINDINTSSKYFKKKSLLLFRNKTKDFFVEKEVEQITLDYFIQENKISKIDFLKIDTEGYEFNVLLGLQNEFKKVSMIMFEHHYDNMIIKNYNFRDINQLLKQNNFYQIYKYKMPFRKTFEYIYAQK
ncbi:FkbM family methyltransferase [Candidatus Pelagibacter sp.]|uniref:FkbM family methyltransferase n=1 Tax=Candidatus Pelagibacter sp. TaxID=2024849 RepID=UPI003F83C568